MRMNCRNSSIFYIFSLCFEEFSDWIISDEDIQEFLLVYANFQTRENALKKYEQYFNVTFFSYLLSIDVHGML